MPIMQLVVVSPLMRACETAAAVFGNEYLGFLLPPSLMKQQDEIAEDRSAHDAIALPPGVRIVAHEFARERNGESRSH